MQAQWRHRMIRGSYAIRRPASSSGTRRLQGKRSAAQRRSRFPRQHPHPGQLRDRRALESRLGHQHRRRTAPSTATTQFPTRRVKELPSTLYLTGMNERNYFNAAGYYFRVQREDTEEDNRQRHHLTLHDDQAEQALVHPVIDNNYIVGMPVLGGEMRFDSNLASLTRDESDIRHPPAPFGALLCRRRRHVHARHQPFELEAPLHRRRRPRGDAVHLRAGRRRLDHSTDPAAGLDRRRRDGARHAGGRRAV